MPTRGMNSGGMAPICPCTPMVTAMGACPTIVTALDEAGIPTVIGADCICFLSCRIGDDVWEPAMLDVPWPVCTDKGSLFFLPAIKLFWSDVSKTGALRSPPWL